MRAFRTLLVLMIAVFFTYTGLIGLHHSWNLFPIFFGDIVAMTWSGQFNLDFACLLMFTGLWLAWRHQFSPGGIALGLLGFVGVRRCLRRICFSRATARMATCGWCCSGRRAPDDERHTGACPQGA